MVGRPAPDRDLIWVCDGYTQYNSTFCSDGDLITTASLYLHMNWGWHELYCNPPQNQTDFNGWFAFDDWTITGAGVNYSNLNYEVV